MALVQLVIVVVENSVGGQECRSKLQTITALNPALSPRDKIISTP